MPMIYAKPADLNKMLGKRLCWGGPSVTHNRYFRASYFGTSHSRTRCTF